MAFWLPETLYSPMAAQTVEQAKDWVEDYKIHCCRRGPVKEEGDILLIAREEVNDKGQTPPIHVTVPTEQRKDSTD